MDAGRGDRDGEGNQLNVDDEINGNTGPWRGGSEGGGGRGGSGVGAQKQQLSYLARFSKFHLAISAKIFTSSLFCSRCPISSSSSRRQAMKERSRLL